MELAARAMLDELVRTEGALRSLRPPGPAVRDLDVESTVRAGPLDEPLGDRQAGPPGAGRADDD